MNKQLEKTFISPDDSLEEVMQSMQKTARQVVLVVDEQKHLKGIITDGDIRRSILRGGGADRRAASVMNKTPTTKLPGAAEQEILKVMKSEEIHQVPIVEENGIVVDLKTMDELISPDRKNNWVILMAGGLGTRLRPLTEDRPKPMIEVNDTPILETILQNFVDQGFHRFYITVNYKADMIRNYFGDGSDWNVSIEYYEEEEKLGTAGSLGLLPIQPTEPMIVMNSDLVTNLDFRYLLNYHREHNSVATMCVKEHEVQIPYGVVQADEHRIAGIEEKPVEQFYINTGMYILQPGVLELIPENEEFEMTQLFRGIMDKNMDATIFPLTEYWHDVGRAQDLQEVRSEFSQVFDEE